MLLRYWTSSPQGRAKGAEEVVQEGEQEGVQKVVQYSEYAGRGGVEARSGGGGGGGRGGGVSARWRGGRVR